MLRTWQWARLAALAGALLTVACAPAAATPPAAAPTAVPAAAAPSAPLEIDTLNVAGASPAPTSLPLQVAMDAGYFQEHGLTINLTYVASTVAVQGLVSGSLDLYHGGAATITAALGGGDLIYIAATVDRSALMLFGDKGIASFPDFRGKTVATTAAGAFGEIAVNHTARQYGMVPGQDFSIRYNPNSEAAFAAFTTGQTNGAVVSPPWNLRLQDLGYPLLIDYYQQGLKIIGPAPGVSRAFARVHPNTLKAFLRAYLDGLKRTLDDREYATAVYARANRLEDLQQAAVDYEEGARVWNKDLRVDPAAIEVVLESSPQPNARTARAADFYENSLADEVHATYAVRLFPELAGRP